MTFEEYWGEVEKLKALPGMAIQQLPSSLSATTRKRLMKREPEETARLINTAIEEIDRGSVESIDSLVRKRLWLRNGKMLLSSELSPCPSHWYYG